MSDFFSRYNYFSVFAKYDKCIYYKLMRKFSVTSEELFSDVGRDRDGGREVGSSIIRGIEVS